jgi:SAM-dependent methyltransferase
MRWVAKAALQNALAVAPQGRALQLLLQRKLTKSLPGDDDYFRLKVRMAVRHIDALRRHLPDAGGALRLFEFGAGWDLIGPLIFCGLGLDDQVLADVAPLVQLDLVANSIRQYAALRPEIEATYDRPFRPLGEPSLGSLEELRQRFGIRYLPPGDAPSTALASDSIDFVSSTSTLQHVPEGQIASLLSECRRVLRPGGVMSCHIDMQDGFAEFDSGVTAYNFLRYSDRAWALANSPFYFQNRLRAPDFISLFENAGFDVVERTIREPTDEELAQLQKVPLAPRFRSYTPHDLAVVRLSVVAINP